MKDDYSEIIVNRILSLCKQRDISIYQLSIMSGVSHSTIDNLVNDALEDIYSFIHHIL